MVVPSRRFDLDVLANQIEAEALGRFYVGGERFVGRCGVEAVGPPALIEQAVLEQRFTVEKQPVDTGLSRCTAMLRIPA